MRTIFLLLAFGALLLVSMRDQGSIENLRQQLVEAHAGLSRVNKGSGNPDVGTGESRTGSTPANTPTLPDTAPAAAPDNGQPTRDTDGVSEMHLADAATPAKDAGAAPAAGSAGSPPVAMPEHLPAAGADTRKHSETGEEAPDPHDIYRRARRMLDGIER